MTDTTERLAYTPPQLAERLGVSVDTVRKFIKDGTFRTVRLGSVQLVPADVAHDFLGIARQDPAVVEAAAEAIERIATSAGEAIARVAETVRPYPPLRVVEGGG